jgi:MFS transporter, SP family, solute carrier family 2 (myo-inositol transporter), member 13
LIISPASGLLADRLGRKKVILVADILFILGSAIQAVTTSVWFMIAGRSVIGLAVGAASFVVPLYIAELAPAKFRGQLVTLNVLFITLGQVVAYLIGWSLSGSGGPNGWRWMVGIGALPAGLQCIVMVMMPESPRWLIKVGRSEEARIVLQKVFGIGLEIQETVLTVAKNIEREVREEEEAKRGRMRGKALRDDASCLASLNDSWLELFQVPGNRRALAIACLLQGLQQLCGFVSIPILLTIFILQDPYSCLLMQNSLMYFSATLFSLIGFSDPTLASLSVAVTNFVFTVLSLLLIDRIGRRRILLLSIPVMIFALLLCGVAFHFIILPKDTNSSNPTTTPEGFSKVPLTERTSPLVVLASITLYVAAYGIGMGNVPWQQSELFPLNVRSLGSGISTATNWASNFIVGMTFLPMLEVLSPSWTFVLYAMLCSVGWLLIRQVYPETRGLSLEETGALLKDGWGVAESLRR